jgi:hypothetical protein
MRVDCSSGEENLFSATLTHTQQYSRSRMSEREILREKDEKMRRN